MKSDSTVILLDPAAADMNQVCSSAWIEPGIGCSHDCHGIWQGQAYKRKLGEGADRRVFARSPHKDAEAGQ